MVKFEPPQTPCEDERQTPMKKDLSYRESIKNFPRLSTRLSVQPAEWKGRTRPAAKTPPRVSRWVTTLTRPAYKKFGFAEPHILAHWEAIVGSSLAAYAQPVKLTFPTGQRRQGLLTIEVSGAAALEIQHLEPQILQRINSYYGTATVGRLRMIRSSVGQRRRHPASEHAPSATPLSRLERQRLEATLDSLKTAGVDGALRRLGDHILKRHGALGSGGPRT